MAGVLFLTKSTDTIPISQAPTLAAAFRARVKRSHDQIGYIQFDVDAERWLETTWGEMGQQVARWQAALQQESLNPGDRVALMIRNCKEWVIFEQAALGLGLVVIPLYSNDRPENIGYILQHAGVRLLLIEDNDQWQELAEIHDQLAEQLRVISLSQVQCNAQQPLPIIAVDWLPQKFGEIQALECQPDELTTIVYTSGTTGRSKGVMLSHHNIMWNVHAALQVCAIYPDDRFLSFLPLSHTFERTAGYYLPMVAGASVAYARSIPQLGEDLLEIRPTLLISVPRIFERVYAKIMTQVEQGSAITRMLFNTAVSIGWQHFEYQQQRAPWSPALLLWPLLERLVASKVQAKLGGRLRFAVSGGAALSPDVARLFISLGIPVQQGYGLTETSPIITYNTLQDNIPASIGTPLPGVEIRIGDNDELHTRSPSVMLGYWDNEKATKEIIDPDGWLHTGDKARIENGHVYITGRLKEIIVLATGEKIPPADMETAITLDNLFAQAIVLGEGKPFLTALVVLEEEQYRPLATNLGLDPDNEESLRNEKLHEVLVARVGTQLRSFPGYAQIHKIGVASEPWTVENGLITPTLKIRRLEILEQHASLAAALYVGH
ncbi:Long-chain-fatty-acid--CoA ligase [hydrothermal vent metagenome]|uniref:Long-chain-fatty-acid--CoA ligase n=1 Tax=hydrothermal vent metagenome TaxID=652676 RepID=A0A3B1BL64_9ZZZZ